MRVRTGRRGVTKGGILANPVHLSCICGMYFFEYHVIQEIKSLTNFIDV